jgi:hypothetical protein
MALPAEVYALAEFSPLEDLVLALLRDKFAQVPVRSLITDPTTMPIIVIRLGDGWGVWNGDPRFITTGQLMVDTFADGLNADQDAATLGEAVRVALRDSINVVKPGLGHLTSVEPIHLPRRKADWATAIGPVQYADLPTGTVRYEADYDVAWRRPL